MAPVARLDAESVQRNAMWQSYRASRPSHVFCHRTPMRFDVAVPGVPWA